MPDRLRHLLGIEGLTAGQISHLLDEAKPFQEIQRHPLKKLATLQLDGSKVSDLGGLAGLADLQKLYLGSSLVSSRSRT